MQRKKIYYLGSYDTINSRYRRRYTISATVKMDYIISALNQAGYNVELISPSYILDTKWCFDKGGKKHLNEQTILNLSPSFGSPISVLKYIGIPFTMFFVFLKLLKLKKKDTLIVYHGVWYSLIIIIAKWLKGFQLIVEVEEIYTHAFNRNIKGLKKELDFIKSADKLILVNDLMCGVLFAKKQANIVCYGSYNIDDKSESIDFKDNKIHLVYAGSFSRYKGGAYNAIKVASYLSKEYVLHILGFGNKQEESQLIQDIEKINKESLCKIVFEGKKIGSEYCSFMKGCHIGLNPQKWGDYMLYAYPSKTLAYLCFGLNVITSPLKTLQASTLNKYFHYCEEDSSESIANAIIQIKFHDRATLKNVVKSHNEQFVVALKNLIEK